MNTTDLFWRIEIREAPYSAQRELFCRSTPPAFIRSADDYGDSPADLAAATNSRTFEGNAQRASATCPFQQTREPSTKRLLTIGGRASTLFQKINELIGTVAIDPKLVKNCSFLKCKALSEEGALLL